MNKYKEAIGLVIEFLDPEAELAPQPETEQEALVRRGIIRELEDFAEWITEDDE